MFSKTVINYRAGVSIQVRGQWYAYSLKYFMQHFVEYAQRKALTTVKINKNITQQIPIHDVDSLFNASQSIIAHAPSGSSSKNDAGSFKFLINSREITCPHDSHCYIYDDPLLAIHPDFFPELQISYLHMARFIIDRINKYGAPDGLIADSVIRIIQGETLEDDNIEVLSVLIATLLIAEPKRNPSCFIPTLMVLDLMRHQRTTPFGDLYTWENCLQHEVLTRQNDEVSFHKSYLYPHMVGIPNKFKVKAGKKTKLSEDERELLNADKKYNLLKNQQDIFPSEYLMQLGGYFPMTHRFSFSELDRKRQESKPTLSDKKSFIAICDWLTLHDVAKSIHMHQLNTASHPNLDSERAMLVEVILPELWDSAMQFNAPNFDARLSVSPHFPSLLSMFGYKQSKITPEGVANTLFLTHGSSRYGPEKAGELKLQFQFWSTQNRCDFGIEDVEKVIAATYQI